MLMVMEVAAGGLRLGVGHGVGFGVGHGVLFSVEEEENVKRGDEDSGKM